MFVGCDNLKKVDVINYLYLNMGDHSEHGYVSSKEVAEGTSKEGTSKAVGNNLDGPLGEADEFDRSAEELDAEANKAAVAGDIPRARELKEAAGELKKKSNIAEGPVKVFTQKDLDKSL